MFFFCRKPRNSHCCEHMHEFQAMQELMNTMWTNMKSELTTIRKFCDNTLIPIQQSTSTPKKDVVYI